MTTVVDDQLRTSGLTRRPVPPPRLPTLDPAELFYQRDLNAPPNRTISIQVMGGPRPWFVGYVEQRLNEFLRLSNGWDGRKAEPITIHAVETVVALLSVLTGPMSAAPQLFPLPDGGIELGWRAAGDELEIEINSSGDSHVLAVTAEDETIAEGPLDPLHLDVRIANTRAFLDRLSRQVAAAQRTA
jgi:hypothetical protein